MTDGAATIFSYIREYSFFIHSLLSLKPFLSQSCHIPPFACENNINTFKISKQIFYVKYSNHNYLLLLLKKGSRNFPRSLLSYSVLIKFFKKLCKLFFQFITACRILCSFHSGFKACIFLIFAVSDNKCCFCHCRCELEII